MIADVMFTTILDAAYAAHGVLSLIATSSITNTDSLELDGPERIAIFESGGHTYAAVAAVRDDGVQILNVTNPSSITAAGNITDTDSLELKGASGIATFKSGNHTYAAVAAYYDDGVQILNVTDPSSITAAGNITDTDSLELGGVQGIAIFESGGHTYAAVAAYDEDGIQILNVTDPSNITAAGSIGDTDSLELKGSISITTFESGGHTYAAVAARDDDGVQILNVTDPTRITAAGSIGDTDSLELKGASGIATFKSGNHTYAAVAAYDDSGVQILNVTDPSGITAAGNITDNDSLELISAYGIVTFESGGHTYAAVAAAIDDGVQILDVTNPSNIIAAGSITDNDTTLELNGASGIATFESGGHTYAAVAAFVDNGVQIMRAIIDTTPPVIALEGLSTVTITAGATYSDAGATCTDYVNGSITQTSSSDVDASQAGSYTVTYSCTDAAGNAATQVSRTVIVGSAPDTTPSVILSAASNITDGGNLKLAAPYGITTFESGGHTYAAVAAFGDSGVQILNVTNPSSITAAGSIGNTVSLELEGAAAIATFKLGSHTYAAVAASLDDGVQILNVTDPSSITAAGKIGQHHQP